MTLACPRCRTTYVAPSPEAHHACSRCTNTASAGRSHIISREESRRDLDVAKSLGRPPRVDFCNVPGSMDVAVLIDGDPFDVLTEAQLEEFKRKLEAQDREPSNNPRDQESLHSETTEAG